MTQTATELLGELRATPGARIVGVGDNVLDCYVEEGLCYPGGNALNIAAYTRLFFDGSAGFIGIFGTDRFAAHLRASLDAIGVEHGHSRVAEGANGMAFVAVDADGDRRFVGSNRGGVQARLRLRLDAADAQYLAAADVVHTSVYSSIDESLPGLAEHARVSYDFSTSRDRAAIDAVAPHASVGFFSGEGLDEAEIADLGEYAVGRGLPTVVVTRGGRGARAFEAGGFTDVGIRATEVVDTLGAGDGFITGFITARAAGGDLGQCLRTASVAGAYACTMRGAFGHPVGAGEDAMSQLITYLPTV